MVFGSMSLGRDLHPCSQRSVTTSPEKGSPRHRISFTPDNSIYVGGRGGCLERGDSPLLGRWSLISFFGGHMCSTLFLDES